MSDDNNDVPIGRFTGLNPGEKPVFEVTDLEMLNELFRSTDGSKVDVRITLCRPKDK